jgi:hypothetical protein
MLSVTTAAQANGAGPSVFGLTFDRTVDAGAFLTFVTLVAAFFGWSYKAYKEWRRDEQREAEGGALRLLLRILRDQRGKALSPSELKAIFQSDDLKGLRKAYGGKNFKFKGDPDPEFDKAIYALQWEGKVDFTADDKLVLRTTLEDPRLPLPFDQEHVVEALKTTLAQPKLDSWDIEQLAKLSMRIAPDQTALVLQDALKATESDSDRSRELMLAIARVSRW